MASQPPMTELRASVRALEVIAGRSLGNAAQGQLRPPGGGDDMSGAVLISVVAAIVTASQVSAQTVGGRLHDTIEFQVGLGALYGTSDAPSLAARGRSPRCSNGGLEGLTAR